MTKLNDAEAIHIGGQAVDRVYVGDTLIWPSAAPGVAHVWPGDTFDTDAGDTTAYELGTWFTVAATTDIAGVRVWNPGVRAFPSGFFGPRRARLWLVDTTTLLAAVDLPDTLPTGWSQWPFDVSVACPSGATYAVSYSCNGSGGQADYGYTAGGYPVVGGPVTLTGGHFVTTPGQMPADGAGAAFYGVDVLYLT